MVLRPNRYAKYNFSVVGWVHICCNAVAIVSAVADKFLIVKTIFYNNACMHIAFLITVPGIPIWHS